MKTETIQLKIENDFKDRARDIASKRGLTLSLLVRIFLTKLVKNPNETFKFIMSY